MFDIKQIETDLGFGWGWKINLRICGSQQYLSFYFVTLYTNGERRFVCFSVDAAVLYVLEGFLCRSIVVFVWLNALHAHLHSMSMIFDHIYSIHAYTVIYFNPVDLAPTVH